LRKQSDVFSELDESIMIEDHESMDDILALRYGEADVGVVQILYGTGAGLTSTGNEPRLTTCNSTI